MSKQKLIFLVSNDLVTDQRMSKIASTLAHEYDVELWGRRLQKSAPTLPSNYVQKRFSFLFTRGKFFYLEMNIRYFFSLLFKKVDIISVVDCDTLLAGFFAAKCKSSKLVFDAHEYYSEVPELVGRKRIQSIWKAIENKFIPKLKNTYTVNNSLAQLFLDKWGTQFEVIRNVPVKKIVESNTLENKTILYQGAVNIGRGLQELIDALANNDQYKLKICGSGDILKELQKHKTNANISNVDFEGQINPIQLYQFTKDAWCGVNLLENKGLNYYYSLANKFWDYACAGKPQICMDFPEYKALNEEFEVAVLIPDLKVETIRCAINTLEDEAFYAKLQSNCRKLIEHNNWHIESQKLLTFYKNLE